VPKTIKLLVFGILLLISQYSFSHNWTQFGKDGTSLDFIDFDATSVQKIDGNLAIKLLYNFPKPQRADDMLAFSRVDRTLFDCVQKKTKVLTRTYYPRRLPEGDGKQTPVLSEWENVDLNSTDGRVLRSLCNRFKDFSDTPANSMPAGPITAPQPKIMEDVRSQNQQAKQCEELRKSTLGAMYYLEKAGTIDTRANTSDINNCLANIFKGLRPIYSAVFGYDSFYQQCRRQSIKEKYKKLGEIGDRSAGPDCQKNAQEMYRISSEILTSLLRAE
jgi:hypothetical protein